ncbi:MAG: discoidin domain-containing protein [Clostridia bacterium]|nr:discoidin domain-containing protein [Clostridia bacterium]
MKIFISSVLCIALAFSHLVFSRVPEVKAADSLISYMTSQHPRLQLTGFEEIREKINSDSYAAALYGAIKKNADAMLDTPPFAYNIEKLASEKSNSGIIPSNSVLPIFYTLALVTEIEDDSRYLDKLWAETEAAINLPNWNPLHWLDTAQMLHSVSIAYDWCYHRWTDEQRGAMEDAIYNLGLEPAVREYAGDTMWYEWHYSFEGETMSYNWNPVCNKGVIYGAIAIGDIMPDFCDTMLNNAIRSISDGLLEFYPDGGFPEGTGYWKFALNNIVAATSAIETAFGGFDGLPELEAPHHYNFLEAPGVADAGDFATYLQGAPLSVNYGDTTAGNVYGAAQVYIATKLDKPEQLVHFMNMAPNLNNVTNFSRWDDLVQALVYYQPMDLTTDNVSLDKNFDIGISTMRSSWARNDSTVFVSMKAGLNGLTHQHWDLGAFAIDALGQRWIKLPGAVNYSWSGKVAKQSYIRRPEGNNVVVVNPDESFGQMEENEKTPLISHGSSTDEGYFVYDMTPAYEDYIDTYKRGIKLFDDRSRIIVQDEIVFSEAENDVWWFAKTDAEMVVADDGKSAMFYQGGKKMLVRILAPNSAEFILKEAAPLPTSPDPEVQPSTYGTKLAINMQCQGNTTIAVEFIPLAGNQAAPGDVTKVTPLDSWKVSGKEGNRLSSIAAGSVAMLQGRSLAYANGEKVLIDSENPEVIPLTKNDRIMVPLRFISESLGGSVQWNGESREVTVNCDYREVKIKIDENYIVANGKTIEIDSPAFIENGRTYIPLRAVSEALEKYVDYDNGLVLVSDTEKPYADYPELYEELKSVLKYDIEINGEKAFYFHPEKTQYYVLSNKENVVKVSIAGGEVIEESGNEQVVVNLEGTDYTFFFADNEYQLTEPYLKEINLHCIEEEEYIPEGSEGATHIPVVAVTDSTNDGNIGKGAFDGSIETRWSGLTPTEEDGGEKCAYLTADFGEIKKVTHMHVAWFNGDIRCDIFDIQTSVDAKEWTTVYSGQSSGLTLDMQLFELEPTEARYVRYAGKGNTSNEYNSITEIRYYSSLADAQADAEDWEELNNNNKFSFEAGEVYRFRVDGIMSDGTIVDIAPSDVSFMVDDENNAYIDENGTLEIYEAENIDVYAYVQKGRYHRRARYNLNAQ